MFVYSFESVQLLTPLSLYLKLMIIASSLLDSNINTQSETTKAENKLLRLEMYTSQVVVVDFEIESSHTV